MPGFETAQIITNTITSCRRCLFWSVKVHYEVRPAMRHSLRGCNLRNKPMIQWAISPATLLACTCVSIHISWEIRSAIKQFPYSTHSRASNWYFHSYFGFWSQIARISLQCCHHSYRSLIDFRRLREQSGLSHLHDWIVQPWICTILHCITFIQPQKTLIDEWNTQFDNTHSLSWCYIICGEELITYACWPEVWSEALLLK